MIFDLHLLRLAIGPINDLELSRVRLDKRGEALNPITVVAIQNPVDIPDLGLVNMATHHTVISIVTDAWHPQVNGVVRTLLNTASQLRRMGVQVEIVSPALFKTIPCPSYP